jgi:hypothetical protein
MRLIGWLGVRARHVASRRLEPLRTSLGISRARITDATPQASPIRRSGVLGYIDTLLSVCYTTVMDAKSRYKVRRVVSRGTPSYQLGHYEMTGKPGSRRSVFRVLVHLGEHQTPEAALEAWREDVERARRVGREKTAARTEAKIRKLEGALSSDRTEAR